MLLASALSIIDVDCQPRIILGLITAVLGAGLAIGILYRRYLVWIAATLLASVNAVVHAFQLISDDGCFFRG